MALNNIFTNLINERRRYLNRKSTRRGGPSKQEIDKALARYIIEESFSVESGTLIDLDIPDDFAFTTDNYLQKYALVNDEYQRSDIPEMPMNGGSYVWTPICAPSYTYPQHKMYGDYIRIYPPIPAGETVYFRYFRKPYTPNWTYIQASGSNTPIFNGSDDAFQDVDLYEHRTEELITEILVLAGLSIKEQNAVQVGSVLKQSDNSEDSAV